MNAPGAPGFRAWNWRLHEVRPRGEICRSDRRREIRLAIPVGIGKPILSVNALYALAQADRTLTVRGIDVSKALKNGRHINFFVALIF